MTITTKLPIPFPLTTEEANKLIILYKMPPELVAEVVLLTNTVEERNSLITFLCINKFLTLHGMPTLELQDLLIIPLDRFSPVLAVFTKFTKALALGEVELLSGKD